MNLLTKPSSALLIAILRIFEFSSYSNIKKIDNFISNKIKLINFYRNNNYLLV